MNKLLSPIGKMLPCIALALAMTACGPQDGGGQAGNQPASLSSGQVQLSAAAPVGHYAAARFAEQASFGPTPDLVAQLRTDGFVRWLDAQLAMPASQLNLASFLSYPNPIPNSEWHAYQRMVPNLFLSSPDQLRARVAWALSQFIVVSDRKGDFVGALYWMNMLMQHGLGNYRDLLYQVSVHPMMGQYLDNNQNRPKSAECPHCAPNENYARELMQLFSLGVLQLNADGTPRRGANGQFLETYTQRDVEELARVLTGWQHNPDPPNRRDRDWANWAKPMVPSTWPPERDSGKKVVLGRTFPAGQSQEKDLRDAIDLLMNHPNIAPFVATRLIQHLVKSDPTPQYVSRVSAVFRDNGQGVAGDLKAVVRQVLLDPEARAGDMPGRGRRDDGKLREPLLQLTALWRGLGCTRIPQYPDGWTHAPQGQRPLNAESVFSFYAPTDRAPGSNILAPEQRLINSSELTDRLTLTYRHFSNNRNDLGLMLQAGCQVDRLVQAYGQSTSAYLDMLSMRYFRGAMPPTLRSNIEQLIAEPAWGRDDTTQGALRMLDYALSTPYYGVIK
ncbi:MAG: hypothetical protein RL014_2741 [Pseudomonadota bacterium]|jgi:uncharacterized protein (DUF1800 family)